MLVSLFFVLGDFATPVINKLRFLVVSAGILVFFGEIVMIANVPTSGDFYKTGKELLAFSWDIVAKLLVNLDEAEYYGVDASEVSEDYWALSQRQLTTALAIMQQGIEFLIKGRICEISPFLLISDSPSKWPSPYTGESIEFSKFRTIDAQDLIKVHDTFSSKCFDGHFTNLFNELREKRNTIMHSINKGIDVQFGEIIDALLYMHKTLFPDESWAVVRRESLQSSPNTELGSADYISNEICRELSIIINLLPRAKVKQYFKIDKKKRAYFCPECHYDANHDSDDFSYKLARLTSGSSKCTDLYCPVCDKEHEVLREECTKDYDPECPGNVIGGGFDMCLTCGH